MDTLISINGESIQTLEIILLTTFISLLPSLLVMMTSFARYLISFSFLRSAMNVQNVPPNMVLVGLALFLTLFTMNPTLTEIKTEAYDPYVAEEITQEEFFDRAQEPLKEFMVRNIKTKTLQTFCNMAGVELPETVNVQTICEEVPFRVVVPAFMTCELQRAFEIGFLLYIPFLVLDVVVACTLMSMGMIMLPPAMISTPFKLLLFVTLNGWELVFSALVAGVQ